MKNTKKKVTRSLSDWRALYYSFKGARLVINFLSVITFLIIIGYNIYHYMWISQSYAQDYETLWLLFPLFGILFVFVILTMIQTTIEKHYRSAIKLAKHRHVRHQITIQDMMDIRESIIVEEIMRKIDETHNITTEQLESTK